MQKAIWNNTKITAAVVAENYEYEKIVRKASANGELKCPQKDCSSPILRYCNGDIKGAYFAHRDLSDCDYTKFEKNYGIMENLTNKLAQVLKKNGYHVETYERLFPGHITYITVEFGEEKPVAVDFITHIKGVETIDEWVQNYKELEIPYSFIVADSNTTIFDEKHTLYAKRNMLNTKDNICIAITWDGESVEQSFYDKKVYSYKNRYCDFLDEFRTDIYSEIANSQELVFEERELTIRGFKKRLGNWLSSKNAYFESWKNKVDQSIEEQKNEILKRQAEKTQLQEEKLRLQEEASQKETERLAALQAKHEAEKIEFENQQRIKRKEKQDQFATENPKTCKIFEYLKLQNNKRIKAEFFYYASGHLNTRKRDKKICDLKLSQTHKRIEIGVDDFTTLFIYILENGSAKQTEKSGAYFINIDMNSVSMENLISEFEKNVIIE